MKQTEDLIPIKIDLNAKEQGLLNESWLAMFGGTVETVLNGMFGGSSVPVNVVGKPSQIKSFEKALGHEAKYLRAMKKHGLNSPSTLNNKHALERAIKGFENETGIIWPFK